MTSEFRCISIVKLFYNRIDCVNLTLRPLLERQREYGYELIVIDNASEDGTTEAIDDLAREFDSLIYVKNPVNYGVAKGRNSGFRIASREFIVYLDDDADVNICDFTKLIKIFRDKGDIGILAFRIWDKPRNAYLNQFGDAGLELANFAGAAHAFRSVVFDKAGFLDERCNFGGEELDMSIRAHSAGYKTIFFPEITVTHHSIIRSGDVRLARRCQWVYNFVRIFFKNFPLGMAFKLACRTLGSHVYWSVREWGLVGSVHIIRSYFDGIRDGCKNRKTVSAQTINFYKSPNLQPDFGNTSLFRKIIGRIR
jgi:GT2 family glycosyltransferase